jgi:formylglycine-generating enzyme required for sulfatase activity
MNPFAPVTLTKPFAISDRPVTWAQFDAFDKTGLARRTATSLEWIS